MFAAPTPFATRALRWLAPLALVLALVVTTASAWLRLNLEGRVCATPGACATAQHVPAEQPVRLAHRIAASTETFLVLALAVMAWRTRRDAPSGMRAGLLALAALLFLAGLGAGAGPSRLPAVTLGNLGGGLLLVGALAWLHGTALEPVHDAGELAPLARRALIGYAAQLVLGTLASAGYAGIDCTAGAACANAWSDASWWQWLDPWQLRAGPDGVAIASPASVALLWLHRLLGTVLGIWLLIYAGRLRAAGLHAQAWAVPALALLQLGLGLSHAGHGLPASLAALHNLAAALLLALLADAAARAATARTSAAFPYR